MAEFLQIKAGEEPFANADYVVIEQTTTGTFRASGAAHRSGEPDFFAPPQMSDLAPMLKVASSWADSHGIRFVHVRMQTDAVMANTQKKEDSIAREEDAAITAENQKLAAKHKATSEGEDEKAENAIRDLSWPVNMP